MKGLREHLAKCEIEYIARHGGGYPGSLKGLRGADALAYLRSIGFRIQKKFMEDTDEGRWIRTMNGLDIFMPSEISLESIYQPKCYVIDVKAEVVAHRKIKAKKEES